VTNTLQLATRKNLIQMSSDIITIVTVMSLLIIIKIKNFNFLTITICSKYEQKNFHCAVLLHKWRKT
jgi:hypothetical protein